MRSTMFGPYRLDVLLGRGGMGEVWKAFDTVRERDVALKLLAVELSSEGQFIERFRREAAITARLQEPHIIPIHDFGEINGRLFIDMRLVPGVDLAAVVDREGPLAPERAVSIIEQIAAALDAAHEDGLVHRDVKPSNVLLTRPSTGPGQPDFVYLIDFGIVRSIATSRLTATGAPIGTWAYMAPERFAGNDVDRRADVYSLACVLFECLTGKPPFVGDDVAVLAGHQLRPVPALAGRTAGLPTELDRVIARGMAKQPADRYDAAGDFASAARAVLVSGGSSPGPTGTPRPVGRSRRGLAVGVVLAAAVLAVAALGIAVAVGRSTSDADRPASTTISAQPEALADPSTSALPSGGAGPSGRVTCPEKRTQNVREGVPPLIEPTSGLDLDCGRVTTTEASPGADISGGSQGGVIDALNDAVRVARVDDIGAQQFDRCAALPASMWTRSVSGLADLRSTGGVCVRTDEGNLAIITFDSPFAGPRMDIRYHVRYRR